MLGNRIETKSYINCTDQRTHFIGKNIYIYMLYLYYISVYICIADNVQSCSLGIKKKQTKNPKYRDGQEISMQIL